MSTGWDFDGQDKVQFTKFGVGLSRIRILQQAPKTRWVHWLPKFQRSINCPGRGCPICEIRKREKANGVKKLTHQMARKMSINIWNYETNRAEVMEQGITFFEDLRDVMSDLKEKGYELDDAILKVRRRGTGKDDTTYRIDIDEITPKEEQLEGIETIDLDEYFKPHTPAQILEVLDVVETSPEKYVERWNKIMYPEKNESDDENDTPDDVDVPEDNKEESDEEFQVE